MKNVDINLGMACNNRCVFCSNGQKAGRARGWMRVEEVEREIDERYHAGLKSLGFIGGEPTLYPHLERVISHARSCGYQRISICTNGSRLSNPDLLDRLATAGLTRVAFSIHSHEAKVEDGITRRAGSFDEKASAIRNLVSVMEAGRLPDGFSLNAVLHAKNVAHLEDFVAFFRELGVVDIRFNFIKPEHLAVGSRTWVPSFSDTTPEVRRLVIRNETEFGLHLTFADFPLCRLPWEILSNPVLFGRYVGEMRDMVTEVTLYRPAESGGTERFNWKEQRTTYLKSHMEPCRSCGLKNKCEGAWTGYLDIYGTDEFLDGPSLAEACRT